MTNPPIAIFQTRISKTKSDREYRVERNTEKRGEPRTHVSGLFSSTAFRLSKTRPQVLSRKAAKSAHSRLDSKTIILNTMFVQLSSPFSKM